jgi:hypothetical protein
MLIEDITDTPEERRNPLMIVYTPYVDPCSVPTKDYSTPPFPHSKACDDGGAETKQEWSPLELAVVARFEKYVRRLAVWRAFCPVPPRCWTKTLRDTLAADSTPAACDDSHPSAETPASLLNADRYRAEASRMVQQATQPCPSSSDNSDADTNHFSGG